MLYSGKEKQSIGEINKKKKKENQTKLFFNEKLALVLVVSRSLGERWIHVGPW